MLTLTGYVLSVIMLVLGLKKPGFAMLGSVLLTILGNNREKLKASVFIFYDLFKVNIETIEKN